MQTDAAQPAAIVARVERHGCVRGKRCRRVDRREQTVPRIVACMLEEGAPRRLVACFVEARDRRARRNTMMLELIPKQAPTVRAARIARALRVRQRDAQRLRIRDRHAAHVTAARLRAIRDQGRRERRRRSIEQLRKRDIERGHDRAIDVEADTRRRIDARGRAKARRQPQTRQCARPVLVEQNDFTAVGVQPTQRIRIVDRVLGAGIAAVVAAAAGTAARCFDDDVVRIEPRKHVRRIPDLPWQAVGVRGTATGERSGKPRATR
jgi:hypothetical protein